MMTPIGHRSWVARVGELGDKPDDSTDEQLKHRLLIFMALLMSVGGLTWGSITTYFGLYLQASVPFGYVVATGLNLAYFRATKRFTHVRFVQVLLSLVLPFLFQFSLGGFAASGAVMLWAMLSIVGALTFTEGRTVAKWLALYSVLAIVSGLVDSTVSTRFGVETGEGAKRLFFVVNIVLISNTTFGLVMYLIAQRERAVSALDSATRQIAGLEEEVRTALKVGQYTLESRLGAGGMGVVYRASHAMLRRPTAIKLLPEEMLGERSIERFEQEVQRTAQLTHPNTITVFDYGRTPEGVFYYAMELLDGASLQDVVESDGPQPESRVVHIIRQAADALSEAHEAGLIHRDIKPANLVLCRYGGRFDHLKVLDFGLVRSIETAETAGITREGDVAGTPAYLAPEALTDRDNLDHRADLYALGAVAYCLLTGQTVFTGQSVAEICGHHIHSKPVRPSERLGYPIHPRIEEIVMQCLEKNPVDRPDSARELVDMIDACGFEPWSQTHAKRWWNDVGVGASKPVEQSTSATRTIDIDMAERGTAPTQRQIPGRTQRG